VEEAVAREQINPAEVADRVAASLGIGMQADSTAISRKTAG
jgi:hypothetical protein